MDCKRLAQPSQTVGACLFSLIKKRENGMAAFRVAQKRDNPANPFSPYPIKAILPPAFPPMLQNEVYFRPPQTHHAKTLFFKDSLYERYPHPPRVGAPPVEIRRHPARLHRCGRL